MLIDDNHFQPGVDNIPAAAETFTRRDFSSGMVLYCPLSVDHRLRHQEQEASNTSNTGAQNKQRNKPTIHL